METRYVVTPIVCDNEVFDTKTNESVVICNSYANAIIIANILNFENERPNYTKSWLADHDKEIRKQVCDDIRCVMQSMNKFEEVYSQLDQIEQGSEKRC